MFKRLLVVMLLVMMVVAVSACSAYKEDGGTGVASPMNPSSAEEILKELGFNMITPVGAKDIAYSIIDYSGGENLGMEENIAQVDFTLDGIEYTYRARSAAEWTDISGSYLNWDEEVDTNVSYTVGKTFIAEDTQFPGEEPEKVGVILWFDAVHYIQYSLLMDREADFRVLWSLAEQLFQPVE